MARIHLSSNLERSSEADGVRLVVTFEGTPTEPLSVERAKRLQNEIHHLMLDRHPVRHD